MLIFGTLPTNALSGSQDSDIIFGGSGDDVIRGFAQPVSQPVDPRIAFSDGADIIFGNEGNDLILAGGGADTVFGGVGADTINGGVGADILFGGAGADIFRYEIIFPSPGGPAPDSLVGPTYRDLIVDYAQGTDRIDLTGWSNPSAAGGAYYDTPPPFQQQLAVSSHIEAGQTIVDIFRPFFIPSEANPLPAATPSGQIGLLGEYILTAADFIFS